MNSNKRKSNLLPDEIESEMGRKSQLHSRKWNLRNTLNSFIAMFMGFVIIYAITLTAQHAN
ncbi:hypothetical protein, partial [Mycobacterium tuberculosis]|uniref:hypothetical protein n=1 Tax=Mycobacterium tuberculosis TaxID=1773 RepID=UPI00254E92A6